jgi:hypothetical protein
MNRHVTGSNPVASHPSEQTGEGQNRGDKTAIELFVAGVGVWEASLQRLAARLADGK